MRRQLIGRLVAAGLAATFAAGTAQAADIQRGGTLTSIIFLEPASLDPIFGTAFSDRRFYNLFYENLVFQDLQGEFHPWLAESWEFSEDGKTLTFHLRDGITFHDDTPFDAEAVKFNLDRLAAAEASRTRAYIADYESSEVLDRLTIQVNLKQPSGAFLAALAIEPGSVASPTAIQEMGEDFHRHPVGTGPFKYGSWTGGRVEGVRNENYWRDGADGEKLPYLDNVVIRVNSNTAVKIVELRSGAAQLGDAIQVRDFDQIERDPGVQLVDYPIGVVQYMAFNVTRPPFDNEDLRKAVAYAINREAVAQVIARTEGMAVKGLEPPTSWAYSDELRGHVLDVEKAREHYAASGHSGPITLSVIQRDPDTQIAQLVQSMLGQAGIELRIEVLERQAWLDKVLGRTYEAGLLQSSLPRPDPDIHFSLFYGREGRQNYSGFSNDRIFDLVDQARSETDQATRRDLYTAVQQEVIDNAYETYLMFRTVKEVESVKLHGLQREFSGNWIYTEAWLEQ